MLKNKIGITFLGDSIMKYKNNSPNTSWLIKIKKKLQNDYKKKISIYSCQRVGLNSRGLLNLISNFFIKIKYKNILIIQIGINDSWYYKSMKGLPEVGINSYKLNLEEIYKKSKISGFKKIIFLNYHKLLNDRIEINKKSLNSNLNIYMKELSTFCKKKKIFLIDIKKKSIGKKNFCLPMPDGIHINNNGAKIYTEIVYKYLNDLINAKKNI